MKYIKNVNFNDEIISIEEIGEKKTIDITVDKDHLFYCNDILTKNSFAIMMTADWSCAVIQTESMEDEGKYLFRLLKTRYSPKNMEGRRAFIGVDVEKQRLYNIDNPYKGLAEFDRNKGKTTTKEEKEEEKSTSKFKKTDEKKYNFKDFNI